MKILIASILPADKASSWSGTCKAIYEQLKKNNDVRICYSSLAHNAQKRLAKYSYLYNKLSGKRLNVYFSKSIAKIYATKLANTEADFSPDLILCLGSGTELYAYQPTAKAYLIADASFSLLQNKYTNYSKLNGAATKESREVEATALLKFDTIFTTSQWALDGFRGNYPKLNYELINLGSNISEEGYIQLPLPRKKEEIKLLTIGTDYHRKGIDKAEILAKEMRCSLTVIGIEKKLDKNKQADRSTLVAHYKSAHFFVLFPTADCTPIVINEANSFGLPVIAFGTGGIATMVCNGENGYLVNTLQEAEEKIRALSQNPELYKSLRLSTYRYYTEHLSYSVMEKKLLPK